MKIFYTTILTTLLTIAIYAQSPHAARLYGMTQYGSSYKKGSVFHYTPSTHIFTTDYDFQVKAKGRTPKCEIVTGNNGKYYGTTTVGGNYNSGVLFEWDSVTSVYKDLYNFTGSDGKDARGGMVLYNNKLYGTTNQGGTNNYGVIYEWDIAANTYTKKIDLDSANGRNPTGSLIVLNNMFYGFTSSGGAHDKGVLFEWNPTTNIYTKKFDFDSIKGSNPVGKLALYNGNLYAMCNKGGAFDAGTIYQWDYATNTVTKTFDFDHANGAFPMGYLTLYNNKFYGTTYEGGIYQTSFSWEHYGVIFEYNPANNAFVKQNDLGLNGGLRGPLGSLTLKGNVFWSTATGDVSGGGGIFTWNPATNQLTDKYSFSAYTSGPCEIERHAIGTQPFESLLLSGDYLLGSASAGGGSNFGTLYKFYPDSNQVTGLVNMEATDGSYPKGSLTKMGNKLYGVTFQGGNSHAGNIFEWDLTTQHFKERFQLDGFTTGIWPKGSLTWYNGKFYGINTQGKLISGNTSFNQRETGDYFSWDPATNVYQSLLSAEYAVSTPVLFNNNLYAAAPISPNAPGGLISALNPAANTLANVAYLANSSGNFCSYQGMEGTNGVTYYNGKFYGMTTGKISSGNTPHRGTIYEWDTTTNVMVHKYDFEDSLGTYPTGNLLLVGNEFYGLTSNTGNSTGSYPGLFKWNPATNVLNNVTRYFGDYAFGTPTLSGGKIYFMKEGSFLQLLEYDPASDTTIIVYSAPIPLFQPGGNWNYTNCTRPPSYQQLLEVIPNQEPILSNIPNTQTVCSNQSHTATFTISDADNDTMSFQMASSNPSLIPVANISITNAGNVYTISYSSMSNQTGTSTISITALDGYGGNVNFAFVVNVNSPNVGITQNLTTLTANQSGATYQWIDCSNNTAIAGANNQSFTAITSGSYAVSITTNNCNDTSACFSVLVNTVGIPEPTKDNSFSIYPNPTNGQFTVLFPTENASIIVTNMMGQEIIKEQAKQKTITLQLDENGVYIVYVKTNQGTTAQKLIVSQ